MHRAKRGDEVEKWLKRQRDLYAEGRSYDERAYWAWTTLDNALDDYRLHADTGTLLCYDVSMMEER